MIITTVRYEACFNTGNYENEKIGLSAQLQEGETVDGVVEALREKTFPLAHKKDVYDERRQAKRDLTELQDKIEQAKKDWEHTADFMQKQGLRADPPRFPQFMRLLGSSDPTADNPDVTETVEVEIVGDDEEDGWKTGH